MQTEVKTIVKEERENTHIISNHMIYKGVNCSTTKVGMLWGYLPADPDRRALPCVPSRPGRPANKEANRSVSVALPSGSGECCGKICTFMPSKPGGPCCVERESGKSVWLVERWEVWLLPQISKLSAPRRTLQMQFAVCLVKNHHFIENA